METRFEAIVESHEFGNEELINKKKRSLSIHRTRSVHFNNLFVRIDERFLFQLHICASTWISFLLALKKTEWFPKM